MHILIFISLSLGYKLDSEYGFRNVTHLFQIVLFCKRKMAYFNLIKLEIYQNRYVTESFFYRITKKITRVQNKIHIDQQISLCKLNNNGKAFTSSFLFPPVIFSLLLVTMFT